MENDLLKIGEKLSEMDFKETDDLANLSSQEIRFVRPLFLAFSGFRLRFCFF